jgi:hypothetical protein
MLLAAAIMFASNGLLAAEPLMQSRDTMPDDSIFKGRAIWEINKIDDDLYTFRWATFRSGAPHSRLQSKLTDGK